MSHPTAHEPKALGIWQQIQEDWEAHGRDWTKPGFRAVAVHRFGVWRMQLQPKLLRAPFSILYRMLFRKIRNTYGIELPYSAQLGRRVIIEHQSAIVVHGHCVIGDDCILRQGVTLGNRYREKPLDAPKLGDRVNVGAGAKLFGAIEIGSDAKLGPMLLSFVMCQQGQQQSDCLPVFYLPRLDQSLMLIR